MQNYGITHGEAYPEMERGPVVKLQTGHGEVYKIVVGPKK